MSRACVFVAGGQRLALRAENVSEVVHLGQVTRIPLTPPYLLGVGNLRGSILPIADLRSVFGVAPRDLEPTADQPTIRCGAAGLEIGLVADEVVGLDEVPDGAPRPVGPAAPEILRRVAVGELELSGRTTVLLDAEALIAELQITRPVRLAGPGPVPASPSASALVPAARES